MKQLLVTGKPLLGKVCDVRLDRDTWSGDFAKARAVWLSQDGHRTKFSQSVWIRLRDLIEVTPEFIETPEGIYEIENVQS